MPTDLNVAKFARRLLRLERDFKALSTTPRLGNSSIDSGALVINDPVTGDTRVILGQQPDGTSTINHVSSVTPPQPSAPDVESGIGVLYVEWDGTFVGKNLLGPIHDNIDDLVHPYGGTAIEDLEVLRNGNSTIRVQSEGVGGHYPGFTWRIPATDLDPLTEYAFSWWILIPESEPAPWVDGGIVGPLAGSPAIVNTTAGVTVKGEWAQQTVVYTTPEIPFDLHFLVVGIPSSAATSYYNVADLQVERGSAPTAYEKRPTVSELVVPIDFSRVEVHVSDEAGFTPDPTLTLKTTIESPRGGRVAVGVPYDQEFHVRLVARTLAGKGSPPSVEAVGTNRQIKAFDIEEAALIVTKFKTNQHMIF